jgi:hypothetical protein
MSERTAKRNRRVQASLTQTRLNMPASVPATHPNAEIRRRADGSAYTWFPGFRGSDSRQSERLRNRIQAKMKRQMRGVIVKANGYAETRTPVPRQSMTEREKTRIERLATYVIKTPGTVL